MWKTIIKTDASSTVILIRVMVGAVFLSEGIQKFLHPSKLGAGRFEKIGMPIPEILGPFVGGTEIVCGLAILLGFATRIGALGTACVMVVAIFSTKIPILLGQGFLGFQLRELDYYGFWSMAHEMRTDWAMLLGSIFLLISGGGAWSIDRKLADPHSRPKPHDSMEL